jgi:hypothetical protein
MVMGQILERPGTQQDEEDSDQGAQLPVISADNSDSEDNLATMASNNNNEMRKSSQLVVSDHNTCTDKC